MAQSGNPGGELHYVSDIPTEKHEGSRGLRSDDGLWMTEMEKYKLGLTLILFLLKGSLKGSLTMSHLFTSLTVDKHSFQN